MAIRDKLRKNVSPYLEAGEQIQSVFVAQTASQYFALISYWIIIIKNAYRVVAVTDRRILVFQAGRFSTTQIKGLLRELPRSTRIGPASGLWYKTDVLGERLHINKRFHKDINEADAGAGAG
jgi:hypothetical protein